MIDYGYVLHRLKNGLPVEPKEADEVIARLLEDKAILDWVETGNNSKDMGGYWEVRTGDPGTSYEFRKAVKYAMSNADIAKDL